MRILLAFIFAFVSFGSTLTAEDVKHKERKSFDGVPLPDVTVEKNPLRISLPFIQGRMGLSPDELHLKAYSRAKSESVLAAAATDNKSFTTEWFATGFGVGNAIGFDLADGRVVKVQIAWNNPDSDRQAQVPGWLSRLGKATGNDTYLIKNALGGQLIPVHATCGLTFLSMEVDRVEWYLLNHPQSKEIETAMRSKTPVQGMTFEQMKTIFGNPDENSISNGEQRSVWNEKRVVRRMVGGGGSLTAEDMRNRVQAAINRGPEYEVFRTIIAKFVDGNLADFTDRK